MSQLPQGFVSQVLNVPLEKILPSHKVGSSVLGSHKFKVIRASIQEMGVIEPLTLAPIKKGSSHYTLLDGHIRLLALQELKKTHAPCLESTDDERYTYNKRINRLSTVQEHFMIKRAIERGVPKELIARSLNMELSNIDKKLSLLDGICPEAADLLKDRQFSPHISRVIRKMKSVRQVECIELMVAADNVTVSYAEALLASTPVEMLVDGMKPKKIRGITQDQMSRMERELANIKGRYKLAERTCGQDVLNLVVARKYLVKLLENKLVTRHLEQRRPEILEQFRSVIETASLDGENQPNL